MVNDRSRIARALEVVLATGRPLSDWHKEGMPALMNPDRAVKIFLTCERKELVHRIETRFAAMLSAGALEEVKRLAARKLDPLLPAMKAHGVPWLIRHLNGEISIEEAAAGAIMDTRRYTKRQVTWFRNQMKDWLWETPENAHFRSSRPSFQATNDAVLCLTGPFGPIIKPRNESTSRDNVTQYYYSRRRGSGAGWVLERDRRRASGRGPLRAFFIGHADWE